MMSHDLFELHGVEIHSHEIWVTSLATSQDAHVLHCTVHIVISIKNVKE